MHETTTPTYSLSLFPPTISHEFVSLPEALELMENREHFITHINTPGNTQELLEANHYIKVLTFLLFKVNK